MKLVVNAFGARNDKGYMQQVTEILRETAGCEVVIVTNEKPGFEIPPGCETIVTGHRSATMLQKRWWLDVTLPRILNRLAADACISFNSGFSLRAKVPQLWCVDDLLFRLLPREVSNRERRFSQFFFSNCAAKADVILVPSEFFRIQLTATAKADPGKILLLPKFAGAGFRPNSWQEREQTKDRYTGGSEYFVFPGGFLPGKNMLKVLKAFSRFKKWQRSNMKLVITGGSSNRGELAQKLSSFRYREDVVVVDDASVTPALIAAAYAMVYPAVYDEAGLPVIEALQSAIPVITGSAGATREAGGEAAIYVDPEDEEAIAAAMIRLYKEEDLRGRLSAAGQEQIGGFTRESFSRRLMQAVAMATGRETRVNG